MHGGYPVRETDLSALGAALRVALASPYSDFYRKRLQGVDLGPDFPASADVWRRLPFLRKEDITQVSLWERTFVPREDIFTVRYTGGTSGKATLLTPRRTFGHYGRAAARAGARRMLAFVNAAYMSEMARRQEGTLVINCNYPDVNEQYALSAALAARLRADSLLIFPSTAADLAPYLRCVGALERIKVLEFTGERASPAQEAAVRRLYPGAVIVQNYSASEWNGTFGESCAYALSQGLMSFHIDHEHFFSEFIEPESGEPADPRAGPAELVISSLRSDQPFPLVRYKTGDLLAVEEERCPCGEPTPRFRAAGRVEVERTRIFSIEFSLDAVERALSAAPELAPEDFEIEYLEAVRAEGYAHGLRIHARLRTGGVDLARAARAVEQKLKLSKTLSYAQGVREGLLLPLEIAQLLSPTRSAQGKRIRLRSAHGGVVPSHAAAVGGILPID